MCSRPPTSCVLPEKPPLIMPSGWQAGPLVHSYASFFLCLLQLFPPPTCGLHLGQWPLHHSQEKGPCQDGKTSPRGPHQDPGAVPHTELRG